MSSVKNSVDTNTSECSKNETKSLQNCSENGKPNYRERLQKFYLKYNPANIKHVDKYLQIYEGREENLFAILSAKYCTEPKAETPLVRSESKDCFFSERHYSGKRSEFPKSVGPKEGCTDCETPYWASGTLVSDLDLLELLCTHNTDNIELQKCYMGTFLGHPEESWNGMTYICNAPDSVPFSQLKFVGHYWAATLNSEKTIYYQSMMCRRLTLYCTEKCQRDGNHERWRLNVFFVKSKESEYLVRSIWDPVIVPEPMPASQSCFSGRELYSSEMFPTRMSSQSSEEVLQPSPPKLLAEIRGMTEKMLAELEKKIILRLDILDSRVATLEKAVKAN